MSAHQKHILDICDGDSISKNKRQTSISRSTTALSDVKFITKKKLKIDRSNPITLAFQCLDFDLISKIFLHHQAQCEDTDPEPYIVCENVSVEDFNTYVRNVELPISLRFLELNEKKLLIIDWNTSTHETVIKEFRPRFDPGFWKWR